LERESSGDQRVSLVLSRVPIMRRRWIKYALISAGVLFLVVLVAFGLLVFDFGGHNRDRLIRESTSPDGRVVAEIREVITPMHGGPDEVQVLLRSTRSTFGDIIYSQTFECGPDYDAFHVNWRSSNDLIVTYGTCDLGPYASGTDNSTIHKRTSWHDVGITYEPSSHVAHPKLP
jgi:hypothetical protein